MQPNYIYEAHVVGHTQKAKFEQDLNDCIRAIQANGTQLADVQYIGRQSGYWNALVLAVPR